MDIRKVKKLIELLEESGISELEISEGEESVRISRHPRMSHAAANRAGGPVGSICAGRGHGAGRARNPCDRRRRTQAARR